MRRHQIQSRFWIMAVILTLCMLPLLNPSLSHSANTRIEKDSIGEREIPSDAYWGVQTSRAMENFPYNSHQLKQFPDFIIAYTYVKKAAALANNELGILPNEKMTAINQACDEIIA